MFEIETVMQKLSIATGKKETQHSQIVQLKKMMSNEKTNAQLAWTRLDKDFKSQDGYSYTSKKIYLSCLPKNL